MTYASFCIRMYWKYTRERFMVHGRSWSNGVIIILLMVLKNSAAVPLQGRPTYVLQIGLVCSLNGTAVHKPTTYHLTLLKPPPTRTAVGVPTPMAKKT